MPIAIAPFNVEMEIRKIVTDEKSSKHLMELGLTVGSKITLLSSAGGNVIIVVKEGRLCLDRGLASKIIVA